MKKYYSILFLTVVLLGMSNASFSEAVKVIQLTDGSILKGKVLQLNEGVYTLETSDLGEVNINESDILSISSPEALNTQLKGSTATGSTPDAELKNQVQQIQGTILSDKGIMKEIESLLEDDSIKAMLSDPKLLEDVTSYDQQKIEQNTSVQDLMNNPKMQELMKKIEQKIPTE